MQQFFILGEEAVPMIIVGVGYPVKTLMESMPLRTRDYTPTCDPSFDSMLTAELHMPMTSGFAGLFLRTLSEEIIPFVESKYKASNDRAIAGHSFGALFGAYTLFHQPALFNRYLLSSVSLPWDNGSLLKDEEAFLLSAPSRIDASVFVSVGSEEQNGMIPMMQQMNKALRDHGFMGLTLQEKIFENESHTSVVATAFNQGMRALYKVDKQ
jgi:predicted alpha/beta superfamily hydrolase